MTSNGNAEDYDYNEAFGDRAATVQYVNCCSHLTETHHIPLTRIRLLMFRETTHVYSENQPKDINTICGENEEFLYIEACDAHSNDWAQCIGV
jgi:hypothetical protein